MAGASVRGVEALQEELVKAKESLKDVDENIKKLTGRDPGDNRPPQRRVSIGSSPAGPGGREQRLFALARRTVLDETLNPPAKRRAVGGAFSRLGPRVGAPRSRLGRQDSGDEEDPSNKPTIQSSVVASPAESRRREDLVREQNKDEKGRARNRRMFGLLLGTLQKFQTEAKDETEKEQQRKAIEQKLEEKAKQEKDDLRKERQTLFSERRQKQDKLKRLEQKMELVQIHEDWEKETRRLMNFIRTKSKPHLYFLPKSQNSSSEKKLKDTKRVLEGIIKDRRRHLEEEIEELTGMDRDDKDDEEPIKKRKTRSIDYDIPDVEDKEDVMDVQQPQVEVMAQEDVDKEEPFTPKKSDDQPEHIFSPEKSPDKMVTSSPQQSPQKKSPCHAAEIPQEIQAVVDKENKEKRKGSSDSKRKREHGKKELKKRDKKDHVDSDSEDEEARKTEDKDKEKKRRRRKSSDGVHEEKKEAIADMDLKSNIPNGKGKDKKDSHSSSSSSSSGSSSEDSSSSSSSSSSSEDEKDTMDTATVNQKPEDIPFPDMPPIQLEDVPMPDEPDTRFVSQEKIDI